MQNKYFEVNFDGIVGPTHNYSGLSYGNIASDYNRYLVSNPKEAALQGLEKMKFLSDKGIKQAVLPPQMRPHFPTLRSLGFTGNHSEILSQVFKEAPQLLLETSSAACMWTANAATVSPSSNTADGKVHITPANLSSKLHRSIESSATSEILKQIFNDEKYFIIHPILPQGIYFSDEGAANHMLLCNDYGSSGLEVFVYGRSQLTLNSQLPNRFPARQTYEASQAIARLHQLPTSQTCFVQQHPKAIDAGAFHNDVVAVSNKNVLLFHEEAFSEKNAFLQEIYEKSKQLSNLRLSIHEIKSQDISLEDAITCYLFNSQLVCTTENNMLLVAPIECQEIPHVKQYIDNLISSPSNPISSVEYLNLRQSMRNGGGPACLRLRVTLTQEELNALNQQVILTDALYEQLKSWINKHYRDRLLPHDLADPQLLVETAYCLEELSQILKLQIEIY